MCYLKDFTHFPRKIALTGLPSIWFPFAVADTILFEATLYIAAYHHADLHGKRENILSIAHKGKMLRLINRRLGDPKAGLTDGTLCAVAVLTGCEVRRPYS
jgi:Fungal specific transcription factor domain